MKTLKGVVTTRDGTEVKSFEVPAQQPSGEIPIDGLESGTDYFVRVKSVNGDGRTSDYTTSEPFKTG